MTMVRIYGRQFTSYFRESYGSENGIIRSKLFEFMKRFMWSNMCSIILDFRFFNSYVRFVCMFMWVFMCDGGYLMKFDIFYILVT